LKGSMKLTLFTKDALDLTKVVGEMVRKGFWTAKVVPAEGGFEILSPEPGLIGAKVVDDQVSYKLYASNEGSSLTLFGDLDRPFLKVAELVGLLAAGGCGEECITAAELTASVSAEGFCSFGQIELERVGTLSVSGLVARKEGEVVSVVPLNENSYLMVYTVKGDWNTVKSRALSLHALLPQTLEVVKRWTCQQ